MNFFVGLRPSLAAVTRLSANFNGKSLPRARLTHTDDWHVTLVFIGEPADWRLPDVSDAVTEAAAEVKPFEVRLAGGGCFGTSVLFARLAGDTAALANTAQAVCGGLERHGVDFDRRKFTPHLTVARFGRGTSSREVRDGVAGLETHQGPQWTVNELLLYRSTATGYQIVEQFRLK